MSARPDPAGWPSLILGGLAADGDPLAYANSVVDNPEACSILKEAHSAMLAGDMPRVQKLRTDIDAVMSGPSGCPIRHLATWLQTRLECCPPQSFQQTTLMLG